MRQIKFRAWDKKNKQMLGVDGINFNEFGFQAFKGAAVVCDLPKTELGQIIRLSEVELMQYTGLKDKNGVDLYEGDIFKTINGVVAVVEWDENNGRFLGFTLERERKIVYVGRDPAVEIIGNIHDNPALIGGSGNE